MAVYEYRMPELGEGLHEGEIIKWHVKPGDAIQEDDILLEVQNDKAVVEVPSPVTGTVKELKVAEGAAAVVGDVLAVFEVQGEADVPQQAGAGEQAGEQGVREADADAGYAATAPEPELRPGTEPAAAAPQAAGGSGAQPAGGSPVQAAPAQAMEPGLILATPAVRKLAREMGVDLARVRPTGKHGRITREDVLAAAGAGAPQAAAPSAGAAQGAAAPGAPAETEAPAAAAFAPAVRAAAEERVPLRGVRKAIAQAMVKSVYTAPHVTVMDEADVTALVALRERAKPIAEQRGVKLTYLPFIVKALIAAARKYPILNASLDEASNEIVYKKDYHVGIAADTEQGLVVPVVFDADRKNMFQIAAEIRDLAERAREGKLAPQEMRGSTITITNIGSAGGMFFTPVINYPEAAILGIGRIAEKPAVRDGEIVVGKTMALSLSFDHRLIDGATAQYALNHIKTLLADPELLIMEV